MALTADELTAIRAWVGNEPTDAELNERYDRLESLDAVVEETLEAKLALLLEQPSSVSLPSGLSVTITQNMTEMRQTLKRFKNTTSLDDPIAGDIPGVSKLHRADRR